MICKNCNKEIADGSRFCEFCGAPQDVAQPTSQTADQPVNQTGVASAQPQQNANNFNQTQGQFNQAQGQFNQTQFGGGGQFQQRQPMDPKVKRVIIAIVALIAAIGGFFYGYKKIHKEKIDITKYIKIQCEGYDGNGRATYDLDSDKFGKAILKGMGKSEKDMDKLLSKDEDKYEDLEKCIKDMDIDFDKDEDLSNGDEIKLKIKYNNDLISKYGIKFTGSEIKYKVKDLDEIKEIDPFENVTVTFSGTSPNCSATVKNDSKEDVLQYVYFKLDKSYGLQEGDEVTVSIDENEDYYIKQYGVKFTSTSKKFKVENVDKYVTSSDEIDAAFLGEMQKQVEDVINSYFAKNSEYIGVNGALNYEGYYLLTAKNNDTWDYHNKIYIIYSATVHNKANDGKKRKDDDYDKDAFKDTKVYFPVLLTNMMKYADGSLYVDYSYVNEYSLDGSTDLNFGWSSVKGYTDLSLLKNSLVDGELATYEYTGTGTFAGQ